jgi:conserved oligomeric Golgi complex subunit 4
MAVFFFRRSVEKAFQLDESPSGLFLNVNRPLEGSPPFIISAVDVVMYIVNAVIQKSISTSQRNVVSSVIISVGRVLGSDFVVMIQRKMRDESYPLPLIKGGYPPEDKIISFIVLINSLDMANQYLARVISSKIGSEDDQQNGATRTSPLKDSFPLERDMIAVAAELNSLHTTFTSKTSALIRDGLGALLGNVIQARLRPVMTETFRDIDYSLTEEELAEIAEQNEEDEEHWQEKVPRRFEDGWDQLMKPLARLMTPDTFAMLLDQTAKYLAKILERRLWGSSGRPNAFGAIRMERDFSGIVSVVSRGNYGVRELFSKVTQILMIANMEEEEWEELGDSGSNGQEPGMGYEWVLTEDERIKARNLVRE